jgi:uncharacterized membrane protein YccC
MDQVRELLFKTRTIVQESTPEGRRLLLIFSESVDLFEEISAIYYNYTTLRQQFGATGLLEPISRLIRQAADDLEALGIAVQSSTLFTPQNFSNELSGHRARADHYAEENGVSVVVFKKILVNLRRITGRIHDISRYLHNREQKELPAGRREYHRFVGHQSLDPKIFRDNLTFRSSVFRHALRVAIACLAGFITARLVAQNTHSYWILMTITFMVKPAFSLTRQRNMERVTGTLAGGALGFVLLLFIQDSTFRLVLLILFMLGTYTFQRKQYLVSVICMTPMILILFSFLGVGFTGLLRERLLDTVIGCLIALAAAYFLFPDWEKDQIKQFLAAMLKANTAYLEKVRDLCKGIPVPDTEYRLARKGVYVAAADLAAAFQRMLSEPARQQHRQQDLHRFLVYNHILSSNLSSVAGSLRQRKNAAGPMRGCQVADMVRAELLESQRLLDPGLELEPKPIGGKDLPAGGNGPEDADAALITEQFLFLKGIAASIRKTTQELTSEAAIQSPARNR